MSFKGFREVEGDRGFTLINSGDQERAIKLRHEFGDPVLSSTFEFVTPMFGG